jgi:hypothetical protein
MFVVTTVFLVGLVFTVQQLLFQYTSVNPKDAFLMNEYGIVKSVRDAVTTTMHGSATCQDFKNNMGVLESFLDKRGAITGFSIELKHNVTCEYWGNAYPDPVPANISVRVLGGKVDSTTKFGVYRT